MPGRPIYGELYRAQLEQQSSFSAILRGRIGYNTTSLRPVIDDGSLVRALLTNDQRCIFGNDATAANNVRLHRGANTYLQLVPGNEASAEGVLATAIAEFDIKAPNYASGSLPSAGNTGRWAYVTNDGVPAFDNNVAWIRLVGATSTQTLTNKTLAFASNTLTGVASTSTAQTLLLKTFGDAPILTKIATPSAPAAGTVAVYPKSDDNLYYQTSGGSEIQLLSSSSAETRPNFLYNSRFLIWQRGTSVTAANAATAYQADRWYIKNSLGTNGILTFARAASTDTGAVYDASVKITTAPTAAQANGCELYQTLENADSLQLYNQTASFSIRVKALGNVNQVGVQFFYKTTEGKVDTSIGSEQTVSVSTGSYATATISGQALGTSMTVNGSIGVRIRITTVSSGNTYDLNNGFLVTAAMLNIGSSAATYQPKQRAFQSEIADCERFYQKSYDLTQDPGGVSSAGQVRFRSFSAGGDALYPTVFRSRMRTAPTVTVYNPSSGGSGSGRGSDGNNYTAAVGSPTAQTAVEVTFTAVVNAIQIAWHWTAEGEI